MTGGPGTDFPVPCSHEYTLIASRTPEGGITGNNYKCGIVELDEKGETLKYITSYSFCHEFSFNTFQEEVVFLGESRVNILACFWSVFPSLPPDYQLSDFVRFYALYPSPSGQTYYLNAGIGRICRFCITPPPLPLRCSFWLPWPLTSSCFHSLLSRP